jgi:hypothetical protein
MPCGAGDLILLVRQDVRGWSWVLDGPDAKNAASATDENDAKKACINVAKARFRRRVGKCRKCHEGNYGLAGVLGGARADERKTR